MYHISMSKERILYFAYGSNLNLGQMARRCPRARRVQPYSHAGYQLVFRGVADITPSSEDVVFGGLWEITKACELALDRYEGYQPNRPESGMYRKIYWRDRVQGEPVQIMAYTMNSHRFAMPVDAYFESIRQGYFDWGLDTRMLDEALDATRFQARMRTRMT